MNTMLGKCSSCGKKIIDIKIKGKKASLKKLENYCEHIIELSNETIMRVAVCSECKYELVAGEAVKIGKKIVKNHIAYWEEMHKKNKKLKTNFKDIKLVNPNTDLRTFLKKQTGKEEIIDIKKLS